MMIGFFQLFVGLIVTILAVVFAACAQPAFAGAWTGALAMTL